MGEADAEAIRRAGRRATVQRMLDHMNTLRAEGHDFAADSAIAAAAAVLPDEPDLARHAGWSAMHMKEWGEALRRWEAARVRFPDMVEAYVEAGLALRALADVSGERALLDEAARRFPADPRPAWQLALNAERAGDLGEAELRLTGYCAAFPDDAGGPTELQRIRYQRRFNAAMTEGSAVTDAPAPSPTALADMAPDQVLGAFEGLGENCEFAFVQRRFGAEPLSLLRWGYVSLDMLLNGLESAFEGVGEPAHTQVAVNEVGELMVSDPRFFLSVHTHVHRDTVDPAEFLAEMCRRLRFLRRKLLAELQVGSKVFVYKRVGAATDDEPSRLLGALRRHGPARLLWVSRPGPERPRGTVQRVADGLVTAQLPVVDRPLVEPIDHEAWLYASRTALRLV